MQSPSIVEALDPVDDVQAGLGARWVVHLVHAFDFQRLEDPGVNARTSLREYPKIRAARNSTQTSGATVGRDGRVT